MQEGTGDKKELGNLGSEGIFVHRGEGESTAGEGAVLYDIG